MSGPTTVVITGDPISTLLSAAAIRAAEAIARGYAEAADLRAQHAEARAAGRSRQDAAVSAGMAALEAEAAAAEARLEKLLDLAVQLGAAARAEPPLRPAAGDVLALAAYVNALQALAADLESIVRTEAARQQADLAAAPASFAIPAQARPAEIRSAAQGLLARIAHLGPAPADIDQLARAIEATPPGQRFDLLLAELRLRIQSHAEAVQKQLVQAATATVVEQSLKDLGYQVEEISDTLFVQGGMVHFRRPGWGDHMVRMRVDAKANTANFNVLRAVDAGANEQSVLDHLAEDRWCAEFPALMRALAARGVHLQVSRRLAAGELPVQLVARDKLPKFADEEAMAPQSRPLAREIK